MTIVLVTLAAHAQPVEIAVPDLTGLTPPAAAALLGRLGLQLGDERIIAMDPASDDPENTVAGQSPAGGELVVAGSAVDIDVLRLINARLIYDDNDLTLINLGTDPLNLTSVEFETVESTVPAGFPASRWADVLAAGQCGQVWSIARTESKPIDGCGFIIWRTDSRSQSHFWTQTAGVSQFAVLQDGVQRGTCEAAGPSSQNAPLRCDIVFDRLHEAEVTGYVYFAYTHDAFVVHNRSEDRWMVLDSAVVEGRGPLLAAFSDSPQRLAPGQCVVLSPEQDARPPVECDVVSRAVASPAVSFWRSRFRVAGRDRFPRACEAAESGFLSICILPR